MATRYPETNEIVTFKDAMDRVMNDAFGGTRFRTLWPSDGEVSRAVLPLDAYATDEEFVLIAAVPGVDPEALEVTINKNTITLTGETPDVTASEEAKDAQWYLHELPSGSFSRSVTVPSDVDASKADASFENGVLKLVLPKAEASKPRRIKIRPAANQDSTAAEAVTTESAS